MDKSFDQFYRDLKGIEGIVVQNFNAVKKEISVKQDIYEHVIEWIGQRPTLKSLRPISPNFSLLLILILVVGSILFESTSNDLLLVLIASTTVFSAIIVVALNYRKIKNSFSRVYKENLKSSHEELVQLLNASGI